MAVKNEIEQVKKFHKDRIREFAQDEMGIDMYAYYFLGGDRYKRARCYGDLFTYIQSQPVDSYSLAIVPLKFTRNLGYFNYVSLFKELNKMYGHYFKIGKYYSGYKYTRLVHINPIKNPQWKSLWWGGLYTMYLLLRKINAQYYDYWRDYFKDYPRKKGISTWKDVITISETKFGDDDYYLHDELFKICWNKQGGIDDWIDNYLNMLNGVFGKGMIGDNDKLVMGPAIYNTNMINGLLRFWESAK